MNKIRLAVAGYGNIGKAVITNLPNFPDFTFVGIFSRRKIESDYSVFAYEDAKSLKNEIDIVVMCGGSKTDLPSQSPEMAKYFNIVDSFDTHAKALEHFNAVGAAAKSAGTLAAISIGWDPGLFSLNRALFDSVIPNGAEYTFWGKGVSQGHSDALRRVPGVKKAVQYTVPKQTAIDKIKSQGIPALTTKEKHLRECFVVLESGADKFKIEKQITAMPDYFAGYDTKVYFISESEFDKSHTALPHGGFVLRKGETSKQSRHLLEFSIKLDSNPEFTSACLLACARAVVRMHKEGGTGAVTIFDIPPAYLSNLTNDELIKKFL